MATGQNISEKLYQVGMFESVLHIGRRDCLPGVLSHEYQANNRFFSVDDPAPRYETCLSFADVTRRHIVEKTEDSPFSSRKLNGSQPIFDCFWTGDVECARKRHAESRYSRAFNPPNGCL